MYPSYSYPFKWKKKSLPMFFGVYLSFNKGAFEGVKTFSPLKQTVTAWVPKFYPFYIYNYFSCKKKCNNVMLCLCLASTLMVELAFRSQIPSWNISWQFSSGQYVLVCLMIAEVSNSYSFRNNFLPVFDFIPFQTKFFSNERTCQLLDKSYMTVYSIIFWMEQNNK